VRIDAARAHLEQVKDALGDDAGLAREIALLDALRPLLEDRRGCSAYSY
jgi:hypothetical protein